MNGDTVQTTIFHPEDLSDRIRRHLSESSERIYKESGKIYLKLMNSVICCPDTPAGNELIHELLTCSGEYVSKPGKASDVYAMILKDSQYLPEQALLKRYRIKPDIHRNIAVFRCFSSISKDLFSIFSEIIPLEPADVIIPFDFRTVIIIKEMENTADCELIEYAEAVIGTMESEGIPEIRAGIGTGTDKLENLRQILDEGTAALRLGMKYRRREHVYPYRSLTLERIVDCIPDENIQAVRKEYLNTDALTVLNDEMMDTVRSFFLNDLNLTAASRELFIHRNTLNYRLDKIKKDIGLDLRSFQDAVIFKIISMLPEDSKE